MRRLDYWSRSLKWRSRPIGLGIVAGLSTLGLSSSALIQRSPALAEIGEPVQGQEAIAPVDALRTDAKSDMAFSDQSPIDQPAQSKHHNTREHPTYAAFDES